MVLHLLLLKCSMPLAYVHPRDVKIFGRPVAQIGIFKARLFFIHTPPQSVSKCQLSSRDSHTHTLSHSLTHSLSLLSLIPLSLATVKLVLDSFESKLTDEADSQPLKNIDNNDDDDEDKKQKQKNYFGSVHLLNFSQKHTTTTYC